MFDRIDEAGLCWPSQLEQVESYLKNTYMRLNVQKLSGDPVSVEVTGNTTLHELKKAVARADQKTQGLNSGLSSTLVFGDDVLREELNSEGSRWKCLAEYGIKHGSTLSLITQNRCLDGIVTIVLRSLTEGSLVPLVVNAAARLEDVCSMIRQREGLETDCIVRLFFLQSDGASASHEIFDYEKTVSECGIEGGTTLGWEWECSRRRSRYPFSELENVDSNKIEMPLKLARKSSELSTASTYLPQTDDEPYIEFDMDQSTPTRSPLLDFDDMSPAVKAKRTQRLKSRDSLKRL